MKVHLSLFILLFLSSPTQAYDLKLELKGLFNTKKLSATDATGSEGVLVSSSLFDPALHVSYSLTKTWKVLLEIYNRSLDFDNTGRVISGDRSFTAQTSQLGVQWIFLSTVAFRLLYTSDKEYGFALNNSNQAVIFEQAIGHITIYYDQILYLASDYYIALNLGYNLNSSSGDIEDRSGTRYGLTMNYDSMNFFYEARKTVKTALSWDYEDEDTFFGLSYMMTF